VGAVVTRGHQKRGRRSEVRVEPGSEWTGGGVIYRILGSDVPAPLYTIPALITEGEGRGSITYLTPSAFDGLAKLSDGEG
jgi:hypothetical protein